MQHRSRISHDKPPGSASRTALIDVRTRSPRTEEPSPARAPATAEQPTAPARRKVSPPGTRLSTLKSRGRKIARPTARFLGWVALVIACYWLAELGEACRVPAPELVVPMIAGVAVALTGLVRSPFPQRASRVVQALVGVLIGSYLQPHALVTAAATSLPLIAVTAMMIMCCGPAALWLARSPKISIIDAALGMAPGGSGGIIACAYDLGADPRQVAFAQYLRVGLVALTAPLIVTAVGGHGAVRSPAIEWPAFAHWVQQPQGVPSVVVLTAICLLGIRLGERLRLPAPVLLGPMVAATIVTFTGTWTGFAPAGPLEDVLFVVIGLEVGLRFTRPAIRGAASILPRLITAIVAVYLLCAGMAWAVATVTGITFVEAYLATAPGGINAVLATAVSSQSDVPLISTVQSLRLFLVLLLMPLLARWLGTRFAPTTARAD